MDVPFPPLAGLRPPPGPRSIVVVLRGCDAAGAWCAQVRDVLETGRAEVVTCDVAEVDGPAGAVVEALARMQLVARRAGGRVRLRRSAKGLREVLGLVGLAEVVPSVERGRQVEQVEEPRIEEGVHADDPPA